MVPCFFLKIFSSLFLSEWRCAASLPAVTSALLSVTYKSCCVCAMKGDSERRALNEDSVCHCGTLSLTLKRLHSHAYNSAV